MAMGWQWKGNDDPMTVGGGKDRQNYVKGIYLKYQKKNSDNDPKH